MSQFRGVKVRVQSGSSTVRQVWKANIGTKTGTFTAGETVTWAGGGSGVYVGDNGQTIEWYRTAGPNPAAGNTLTGSTSAATATIASFPSENLSVTTAVAAYPAAFASSATQGPIATNDDFFVQGQPVAKVSATIGSDSFDLTAAWGGATLTNVEAIINRDRTSVYGWPIPEQGSRLPWEVAKQTFRLIDAQVNAGGGGGGGSPPSAFANLTLVAPWRNVPSRAVTAYSNLPGTDSTEIKGLIDTNGATVSSGAVIVASGGLPTGNRPAERRDYAFGGERFSVEVNGSIVYRTPDQTTVVPGEIGLACVYRTDGS